jgi:hypothetical protein
VGARALSAARTTAILAAAVAVAAAISGPALAAAVTAASSDHYSLADFERVDKIDAHVHLHGSAAQFMAQAQHDRVRVLTINVDYPDFPSIELQQRDAVALRRRYPGQVAFAATISVADFGKEGWAEGELQRIDTALAEGAVGVKVWKNIGLQLRDADGRYVMLDDARLKPIFDRLERGHIVLLGHQAEPLNCWLPFEKMTVRSDREYFREHPQYYMFRHPEVPSHAEQLAARDRMLTQHPTLRFDGVHLASLEWDVDEVSRFLDRFPLAVVDVAARMSHLEHQASRDGDKVRRFLIRYQDRILYGTDIAVLPDDPSGAAQEAHAAWLEDWRFLNTAERMHSSEFDRPFNGLALPKAVADKIYSFNARRVFPTGWELR